MKKLLYIGLGATLLFGSCKNQDWEFPDYDYKAVYFANQYPIRTITFGEDLFDTSLDNEGKFEIYATIGGVYTTTQDVIIDIEVDPSLCQGLAYDNASGGQRDVRPLPAEYYTLASNQIVIPKGSIIGGVQVQLTDAFFMDPLSVNTNYVLPIKMTHVVNADSILSGIPLIDNPHPGLIGNWDPAPKNFSLYSIKYINTWHGMYLRRGVDDIVGKAGHADLTRVDVRKNADIERDQVNQVTTVNRDIANLTLAHAGPDGTNINSNLRLTFDTDGNCSVTTTATDYTVSGSGKFVKRGEKNSWGGQDRDALYLEYTIDHPSMTISSKDTLVARNRGVAMQLFNPWLR